MPAILKKLFWWGVAALAACCLAVLALRRGETVNAAWVIGATVAIQMIGYRFYSRFIADRVLGLDSTRTTPAVRRNDGLDYVPTDRWVVFGHHFAAIAGAGPLVGPVLAAQMGYLPGLLWLLFGVVLAGAVQDFVMLFFSLRRDGSSLGEMIRREIGPAAGTITLIGILMIMMILLAVLALVVVKALAISPWGTFTVAMTIPIALLMGVYLRWLRPGKVMEVSIIGLVLLLASIHFGGSVAADPHWGPLFTFDGKALAWMLIGYGFLAAVLPVWLLLAPRDYLSTFLKIGTVVLLAGAVLVAMPQLQMPAVTRFVDGTGPVFAGGLFPFLFITIACGAVSGWHALVSSGTTPKLLANEADARMIGYGAMLMECFVAVTALIAACALQPGVYFAMNSPAALIGSDVPSAAAAISQWGFVITPEMLTLTAQQIEVDLSLEQTLQRVDAERIDLVGRHPRADHVEPQVGPGQRHASHEAAHGADLVPEAAQGPPRRLAGLPVVGAVRQGRHQAVRQRHRVHGTGAGAAQAVEPEAAVFQQGVEHAPGEGAVRAAALQGQVQGALRPRAARRLRSAPGGAAGHGPVSAPAQCSTGRPAFMRTMPSTMR